MRKKRKKKKKEAEASKLMEREHARNTPECAIAS
jgi:hypothetical protein